MDEKRLEEIRERAEKATPGPWKLSEEPGWVLAEDDVPVVEVMDFDDAPFIAHAREDVPWLLEELEKARGPVGAIDYRADELANMVLRMNEDGARLQKELEKARQEHVRVMVPPMPESELLDHMRQMLEDANWEIANLRLLASGRSPIPPYPAKPPRK